MEVIKVPKTPKSAYNPGRPASALLKAQVEHLEAAAGVQAGDVRKRRRPPRTEGEASKYIEQLTRTLHPQGADAQGLTLSAPSPPTPGRNAPSGKRKVASTARSARTRKKKSASGRRPSPRRRTARRKTR